MVDPITPDGHWTLFRKDHLVWAIPFSLAATKRVSVDFFSSGYLDVSVLPLTSSNSKYIRSESIIHRDGFPHSDTPG